MDSETTFRTSRYLAYPPATVFKAFATDTILASWWGPKGFTNEFAQYEFRTGGAWTFIMVGPDGSRYPNESVFVAVEPAARVVIGHLSIPHFVLAIEMRPEGDGTHLEWVQTFEEATVAKAVCHIVVPANEENLDRLDAALAAMAGNWNRMKGHTESWPKGTN